jgi:hypothetical protein
VIGLARTALRRTGKLLPLARVLLVAELAVEAGRHIAKLTPAERSRLLELLRKGRGRPGALEQEQRDELFALVAKMEPRVFAAAAAGRLSPLPIPRRVLEGGASAVGRAIRGRR